MATVTVRWFSRKIRRKRLVLLFAMRNIPYMWDIYLIIKGFNRWSRYVVNEMIELSITLSLKLSGLSI